MHHFPIIAYSYLYTGPLKTIKGTAVFQKQTIELPAILLGERFIYWVESLVRKSIII